MPYLIAVTSSVFLAGQIIIQKKALFKTGPFTVSLILWGFNLLLIVPALLILEIPSLSIFALILVNSFGYVAMMFFWAAALKNGQISVISPLMNLSPLFVAIFSLIFLKETLTTLQIIGILILVAGGHLLTFKGKIKNILRPIELITSNKGARYLFLFMAVGVFTNILNKIVLKNLGVISLHFYECFFASLLALFIFFAVKKSFKNLKKGFRESGKIIGVTATFETIGDLLYLWALSLAPLSVVFPLKRLATLFSTILGGHIYKEDNLLRKSIACILMIIGASLIVAKYIKI